MLFLALLPAAFTPLHAQQRRELTTMTHSELLELAEYIKAWFETPSAKEVLKDHVGIFGNLHSTAHFTPWHRITVRMLEDFLLTQPNGHNYVPLPKWEPVFADGTLNPLPAYFNGKTPDGNSYPDWFSVPCLGYTGLPDSTTEESWFRSLTSESANIPHNFLYLNDNICTSSTGGTSPFYHCIQSSSDFSDYAAFSDKLEHCYHDRIHAELGASSGMNTPIMGTDRAVCAVTFWPLHAWVDDLRYRYEYECAGSFHVVDPAPINSLVVWSDPRNVTGEVIIEAGGELRITGVATVIQFADSEYNQRRTRIVVKPGGRLEVSGGAKLQGLEQIGEKGHTMHLPGHVVSPQVDTRSAWDGIYVEPVSSSGDTAAKIELSNAHILHARIGIHSPDGSAFITANETTFKNNRYDVILGSRTSTQTNNGSRFNSCNFLTDEKLRDAVWAFVHDHSGSHQHYEYHFKEALSPFPEAHVKLSHVRDVKFNNCWFEHSENHAGHAGVDNNSIHKGEGINAFLSDFKVFGTNFNNLGSGIRSIGDYAASMFNRVQVDLCFFENNLQGVTILGNSLSRIAGSTFNVPATGGIPYGIFAKEGPALLIQDNMFTTWGAGFVNAGIVVENDCDIVNNWLFSNDLTNLGNGVLSQGRSVNLNISCNQFYQFTNKFSIAVVSGELNDQGDCDIFPGGNWWDDLGATGQHHIYKAPNVPGFQYDAHSDRIPTALSSGISIQNCLYTYQERPCEELELYFGSPETTQNARITALQSQINGSTGAEREALEKEQRGALYEVLRKRIDENGPLSAYQFLSQKASEGVGVYPRDLAVSAMDAQLWPAAQQHIYALPATDPDRDFLQWLLPVRQSGRSMAQLTEPEIAAFKILRDTRPSNNCIHVALDNDLLDEVIFDTPFVPNPGPLPEGDKPKNLVPANKDDAQVSSAFRIYPNPANDHINIECPVLPADGLMHIHIYDGMGRRVKQAQTAAAALANVSTGDLTPGLYVVEVRCSGEVFRAKVMVSRR